MPMCEIAGESSLSQERFWSRREVGALILEIVLVIIGERLVNPFFDLFGSVVTQQVPTQSTILFGAAGLLAIVSATILGVFLCQRVYRWVRRAQLAIQQTKQVEPQVESAAKGELTQGLDLCRTMDLPEIEVLLKEARSKSEVWVMGIDCEHWLDNSPEKVKEYVTDHDLSFIFLIAKKDSPILRTAAEAGLISLKSEASIERSTAQFQKIKSELKEKGDKIRLGIYDLPLVHSMAVVNPNTDAERIQVTHYLYKADWVDLPNLSLNRQVLTRKQQIVFDKYHKSIEYVMSRAIDQEGEPLETEPERTYVKLGFQTQIKRDLLEIESQLNFEKPKPIHFKSWDETETEMRKQLIDNETAYGIVENIAKVLNEWNKDLDRASLLMVRPSSQIYFYIQSCGKYYQKLREIGFLS